MKLLSREEFKIQVFKRDNQKCVVCKKPAVDAHHLLDRKLFKDGGYYLNNGASLCDEHHFKAETTEFSVEYLRGLCSIREIKLPDGFSFDKIYDKWGNEINSNGLVPGPLFNDKGCQTMLKVKNSKSF